MPVTPALGRSLRSSRVHKTLSKEKRKERREEKRGGEGRGGKGSWLLRHKGRQRGKRWPGARWASQSIRFSNFQVQWEILSQNIILKKKILNANLWPTHKVQAHSIETDRQTPAAATAPKMQRAKRIQNLSPRLTFTLVSGVEGSAARTFKTEKKKKISVNHFP